MEISEQLTEVEGGGIHPELEGSFGLSSRFGEACAVIVGQVEDDALDVGAEFDQGLEVVGFVEGEGSEQMAWGNPRGRKSLMKTLRGDLRLALGSRHLSHSGQSRHMVGVKRKVRPSRSGWR